MKMGLCCSEKQKKNFEVLTSWKKVRNFGVNVVKEFDLVIFEVKNGISCQHVRVIRELSLICKFRRGLYFKYQCIKCFFSVDSVILVDTGFL